MGSFITFFLFLGKWVGILGPINWLNFWEVLYQNNILGMKIAKVMMLIWYIPMTYQNPHFSKYCFHLICKRRRSHNGIKSYWNGKKIETHIAAYDMWILTRTVRTMVPLRSKMCIQWAWVKFLCFIHQICHKFFQRGTPCKKFSH